MHLCGNPRTQRHHGRCSDRLGLEDNSVDPQLPDGLPTPERAMGHVRTVLVTDDLVIEIGINGRQYATRLQS